MARGSAVIDEIINIGIIIGLILGTKWLVDSGTLGKGFEKLRDVAKDLKLPDINIGGPQRGTGTHIYKTTGRTMSARQEGPKTRNYASGKPSDTTTEWNVDNCPFSAYEFDADVTISKIDHDDTVSMKMYGPQHRDGQGAWYINDITFKSGSFKGGWEKPHPNTTTGCAGGGSIGSIVGKTIHLKSVIWPLAGGGAHVEMYAGGRKLFSGDNPCGKRFSRDRNQQVQLRIDAAPGCRAHNVQVAEISV